MPIYEYRCTACEQKVEVLQKLSDPPLVTCPACAQQTLVKSVTAAGFQLKGSGWYQTDFRSSGAKAPAKPDAAGADAKPAESAAKADAATAKPDAPAAKAETKAATGGTSAA